MEKSVFREPAVAGLLEERFVEARLHNDGKHAEAIRQLQEEMTHSKATPIYLIVDPATGEQHGRMDGASLDLSGGEFREFLAAGMAELEERVGSLR